jgi:hypothetical protein
MWESIAADHKGGQEGDSTSGKWWCGGAMRW